jgi:hypothetical protein
MKPDNTDAIQGKFQKGQSGNPAGKPKGSRHKTTLAVQALLDGEAEGLTRKAVELALAGDITALRLCLERIAPARKDYPVAIELPEITSATNATEIIAAVLDAVANGSITPSEGGEVAKLVDCFVRAVNLKEIEERITKLNHAPVLIIDDIPRMTLEEAAKAYKEMLNS